MRQIIGDREIHIQYNATVSKYSACLDDMDSVAAVHCYSNKIEIVVSEGYVSTEVLANFKPGMIIHGSSAWGCKGNRSESVPFCYQVLGTAHQHNFVVIYANPSSPLLAFDKVSWNLKSDYLPERVQNFNRQREESLSLRRKQHELIIDTFDNVGFPSIDGLGLHKTIDLKPWLGLNKLAESDLVVNFTTSLDLGPIDFIWQLTTSMQYQTCSMCDSESGLSFALCCARNACLYGVPLGIDVSYNKMMVIQQQSLDFDFLFHFSSQTTKSFPFTILEKRLIPGLRFSFFVAEIEFKLEAFFGLSGYTFVRMRSGFDLSMGVSFSRIQAMGGIYDKSRSPQYVSINEHSPLVIDSRFKPSGNVQGSFEVHIIPEVELGFTGSMLGAFVTLGIQVTPSPGTSCPLFPAFVSVHQNVVYPVVAAEYFTALRAASRQAPLFS